MGLSKNDQFIVINKEQLLEANKQQHPTPFLRKNYENQQKYTKIRHKNLKQNHKKVYYCKEYKDAN